MSFPTDVSVSVDQTEYSRYEYNYDTVTATVTITGGGTYTDEPIVVDLVKARGARTAVVATSTASVTASSDSTYFTTTFKLKNLVDQDLISLVRHGKYFVKAYHEATAASAAVGAGADGTVTLTTSATGSSLNSYTVEVVVSGGTSALYAERVGTVITVHLATSSGVPVGASNSSALVAAAINNAGIGIVAIASGTGSDPLSGAEGPTAFTGGSDEVSGESGDFDIRIVTAHKFKSEYLFGIPLEATNIKFPKFQPVNITGVAVREVSSDHPAGFYTLEYNYYTTDTANAQATIGSGTDGSVVITASGIGVTGSAGNSLLASVVVAGGTVPLSVSYTAPTLTINLATNAGVPATVDNTATLVAAAIDALAEFSATATGTGASSLSTAEAPAFMGGVTAATRVLSWSNGSPVTISGPGTYLLRAGSPSSSPLCRTSNLVNDYITINVTSVLAMPSVRTTDDLLIEPKKLSDDDLGSILDQAISWVEKDFLAGVYLEPTNLVTDRDPTSVQFAAGVNAPTPIFTDEDYDELVSPLSYFVKATTETWVNIWTPWKQLIRVDSLYGAIANTRVIDIDLQWIELSTQQGFIQLVPFNQEIAFDFIGLMWVNSIRGAAELPNFWHFNLIAGLRDTTPDLIELIQKRAAISVLNIVSAAYKPGVGSMSLSRDGVSQSVSYTSQQQFGIFNAAITAYNEWIDKNEKILKGRYVGIQWAVV